MFIKYSLPLCVTALLVGCGGGSSGSKSSHSTPSTFRVLQSPSEQTTVNNVSSDGRVIAGKGTNSNGAVYWVDDVAQPLLPSNDVFFTGGFVSPDGTKVASGTAKAPIVRTIGGSTDSFAVPDGFDRAYATGLGQSTLLAEAFKSRGFHQSYLVQNGVVRLLPVLAPDALAVAARISSSEDVAVGTSDYKPTRWTNLNNPTVEALVPRQGVARGVNADGQVIVGYYSDEVRWVAFRWTPATGAVDLGQLPNKASMIATAVSADGSVVVGNAYDGSLIDDTGQPFIWTAKTGPRAIASLPGFTSPPFEGLVALNAVDVSGNGRVIVGSAKTPGSNGKDVGWVVRLGTF
jgi:probable HAF family extracellular repeat protein